MATIVTRAGKGSALTWTEGDANITNLNNDKIELTDLSVTTGSASGGGSLSYNNTTGAFTFAPADLSGVGSISNIVEDLSPQLGGDLDVNGQQIVSVSNGNIVLAPNGTGNISLTPSTGKIVLGAVDWPSSNPTNNTFLVAQAAGTSAWTNTIKGYNEGSIYDLGTTSGTITPNVTNGNVQTITLNGNLTFSAFTSPTAGQSLTLIVKQDATGSRTLTSTMKFAGASKTLSTAANSIDIISVYYDGTNYYASLAKGFA